MPDDAWGNLASNKADAAPQAVFRSWMLKGLGFRAYRYKLLWDLRFRA